MKQAAQRGSTGARVEMQLFREVINEGISIGFSLYFVLLANPIMYSGSTNDAFS